MDIIDFFRSIDGVLYYVLLVVNTVLIFAIIGYLGEQNNKKIIKMGLNTPTPINNGAMNFSETYTQKHNDIAIPTVAPTAVANDSIQDDIVPQNNLVAPNQVNNQVVESPLDINVQQPVSMLAHQSQNNNKIDPNEKAPAVLVINSQNTDSAK